MKKKKYATIRAYPTDAAYISDVAHYENKVAADVVAEALKALKAKKKGVPVRGSIN